ncbi:MAG: TonB-dependent receptor [Alistipes sp.]|nr:TonB-dependent receptor [Alistipes sp.]
MIRKLCLAALTVIASAPAFAASDDSDSLRRIDIENVVVTGTRNRTDVRHLPLTVSVVARPQIENSMQASLLPLLSEQIPGLFVTQRGIMGYGVSDGAAGGISLRGLSGGNARLMVLIDGHPQYMGLFGHPISDAYQSFIAERVEVLRGPASTLYGSNAMGGVVNIVTRKMYGNGVDTRINAGYGSYNTLRTEAVNRVRHNGFTSVVSLSYNRTDGHRRGMGFEQYGGYAKLGYEIDDNWSLRTDIDVTRFNASNPGAVTNPMAEVRQHVTRGMTSVAVENDYEKSSGGMSFFYNWGNHKLNDGYPLRGGSPKAYLFNSRDRMFGASLYQSLQLFKGNRLTIGFDYYDFGGFSWNRYFRDTRNDQNVLTHKAGDYTDIYQSHEYELAGYLDFRQHIGRLLTFDAGIRYDHHSKAGGEWVPQAGISFHLPAAAEIKLSAAKGFRYPTIKELYMFKPANADLKPESLWSYEFAFSQRLFEGRFSYGVNLFYIDGHNLITTVMVNGIPRNENQNRIENLGVEAELEWHIGSSWSLDANYSYLHMKYPVIAAPEHKLHAGIAYRHRRWMLATGLQYINTLYTSTAPAATENFVLWNMRISFSVSKWLSLWARGDNLLAQRYQINAGYPMPRATAMGGISIGF